MTEATTDDTRRAFFDSLQNTQWMKREELLAYQRQQLAQLLHHAGRTSPFYRERLAPVLRRNGSIDWDRWPEIPIVTRRDLQKHREQIISQDIPARHGSTFTQSTSGTTGEPVKVTWTALTTISRQAAAWRMYEWHDFDYSAELAMALLDYPPWPEGGNDGPWGPPWHDRRGARVTLNSTTPFPRIAEWLGRKRPRYFAGISMTLSAVAEEMAAQNIRNPLVCMLGFGGQATPLCRAIVRKSLGIPVIEMYSAEECGHIAHECAAGSLHILSELVHVEILDDENNPCPPGVEGRVVVTVLHNAAQPTIRYELGDIAAFAPPCSCGRSLPVIAPVSGRIKNMFRFAGEPRVAPSDGRAYKILEKHIDPSWYQIAQTGPMSVEIRFVAKRKPDEESLRRVRQDLPVIWRHAQPEIAFKQLERSPAQPGRKQIVFVNEWESGLGAG